jgi:hypothetical protein
VAVPTERALQPQGSSTIPETARRGHGLPPPPSVGPATPPRHAVRAPVVVVAGPAPCVLVPALAVSPPSRGRAPSPPTAHSRPRGPGPPARAWGPAARRPTRVVMDRGKPHAVRHAGVLAAAGSLFACRGARRIPIPSAFRVA